MSILLHVQKPVVKSTHIESETVSILLISLAIFLAITLVTHMAYMATFTEGSLKVSSSCKDKIAGFEQRGMYTSPDQFKLAMSHCDIR